MSDFGVRIGKVLAALGLCMALFCVPAGAGVKEDLSAIDKAINSIKEQLRQFEKKKYKVSIDEKKLLSEVYNMQGALSRIEYNLNYIWYNNKDRKIDNDIYTIRLNLSSRQLDLRITRTNLEILIRIGLSHIYFEKNWMPYQVPAILDGLFLDGITFDNNDRIFYSKWYPDEYNQDIGIAHWNKRVPELKAYANKRGEDWQNLKTQLDFFQQELETIAPKEIARLRNSKTQEEAIKAFDDFMKFYELLNKSSPRPPLVH
ncbi:phage tail tip lysozyme [Bartonella sp. DGB2]|uniref:phage tail tip lysozyme n=1 Tax=Bartonella sp. DGB2 TaxID=3388426 RepID=UPI00398F99B2